MKNLKKDLHLYNESEKYQNDKKWFKDFMDYIDTISTLTSSDLSFTNDYDEYKAMKINFDLYNGIISKEDFVEYCSTNGYDFNFPTNFINQNIIVDKVKVLEGLEISRPFYFKVLAVNPEATTRKEQKYFDTIKQFVIESIMNEIQTQIEQQKMQQEGTKTLSPKDMQDVQNQTKAMTPDEVKRYMEREYQDPAEVLASQLLQYLMYKLNIKTVFNQGWKKCIISGREIYRCYIRDDEIKFEAVNPLDFDFDRNTNTGFIEDGEWAIAEYKYSLINIATEFPELTDTQLIKIADDLQYDVNDNFYDITSKDTNNKYVRVRHYVWKSLRKIGFLKYMNVQTGEILEKIVPENYKLQPNYGDIEITWSKIVEVYEGWKIGRDNYANLRKVQYIRDIDDINNVKLPYLGSIYDNDNSISTSLVERMKSYQYLYDIVFDRIRTLMASDKGKLLLMNIGLIPRSQKIDLEKWLEYAATLNIGFYNPHEEGNKIMDINSSAKVVDLSLASDIQNYIRLAEYIENRCGESLGVTKQITGRIGPNEAVGNAKQSIQQSSYVLEPYFNMHNHVKRRSLEYLLDLARLAYSKGNKLKVSYTLDDLSSQLLNINSDLLVFNTYGIFISNTAKPDELKQNIVSLAQAALQNQKAEFSDVIKILKTDNIEEATEILEVAEKRMETMQQQMMQEQSKANSQAKDVEHKYKMQEIDEQGIWDLKIAKLKSDNTLQNTLLGQKLVDKDENGIPDVLESQEQALKEEVERTKLKLEKEKIDNEKEIQLKKLELEKEKLKKSNTK